MLDDVYNKRILSLAANIPLLQRLPSPGGKGGLRAAREIGVAQRA